MWWDKKTKEFNLIRYCPDCKKLTVCTREKIDPNDDFSETVVVCSVCKSAVEFVF